MTTSLMTVVSVLETVMTMPVKTEVAHVTRWFTAVPSEGGSGQLLVIVLLDNTFIPHLLVVLSWMIAEGWARGVRRCVMPVLCF